MAAKSSIVPVVVWNWVIEALASSEQADVSTLIDLVKLAPAISGDAGKDTRELVSLRILERLFDHGNEAALDAKTHKISFDSSERCEDVLKKILHGIPEQMDTLETEKWDVGSFLKQKRSSMRKCLLIKLKEAMIENSNPVLASLREKGKVVISNEFEDTKLADGESPTNPTTDKKQFQENILQDHNLLEANIVVKFKDPDNTVQPNNERAAADDERTDIAARKEAFLTAQCTMNQDSLTLTEWSEMDLCMKCNESGELLVCSSDSCPLRVHKCCTFPAVTLEENGDFFCPFCAYSRAISKYQEAKRNVSLAKKNLQAFSSFRVKKSTPNKSPAKHSDLEESEDRQAGVHNVNCMSNEKDSVLPDAVIPDVNNDGDDDDPFLEQKAELTRNPIPEPSSRTPFLEQATAMTRNLTPEPSTPKQKCKEKESQRSTESSLTIRLRKRKVKDSPAPVPMLRRKKLAWTKSEEETLKEGVERYSSGNNSKIPWKDILDFGHKVFHKGRTTVDLKDKWRNICKGSPYAR